jgi:hypothetical protein
MNLLRSICCLFAGRCAEEEPKSSGDLGQTEAKLEKAGKERMEHMEGEGSNRVEQQASKRGTK